MRVTVIATSGNIQDYRGGFSSEQTIRYVIADTPIDACRQLLASLQGIERFSVSCASSDTETIITLILGSDVTNRTALALIETALRVAARG